MHLMRAEVPGPTKGKLVPKMRRTAIILYSIYIALTLIMVIALLLCRMSLYDSVVNALATAGTGGFSVLNSSIGGYQNPAVEWVVAIFMVLFGINFNMYYFLLIRRWRDVLQNEELRVFLILTTMATAAIAINTWQLFDTAGDCLRTVFFQVTTIMSTAGFATTNYDLWPSFSKTILLILMIVAMLNNIIDSYAVRLVLDWLSIYSRYMNFTYGIFDFGAVVYYTSLCVVFLFLSVRVFEKRRWS
jgi:trk system potassium uptake protein TrkH